MADNKFEDTRSSILKLISIFYKSSNQSKLRNLQFEDNVTQIVTRKSINNFELFAYTFDSIYDNNFLSKNSFIEYIQRERNKESKDNKLVNLYLSSMDIEDREKTIDLAFGVFEQHQAMIRNYDSIYINAKRTSEKFESRIFNDKFYSNDYKYTDISFDVFLSHRYFLRFYNIIVFYILTAHYDLIVYVDWIFDHTVDRKKLSEDTVKLLKYRLAQSNKLVFFNIVNSNTTNWMAWEVGYFSCLREDSIAILDLDGYCTGNKNVEVLSSNDRILFDDMKGLYLYGSGLAIRDWV